MKYRLNTEMYSLLCLYRARSKITHLSIPTHAQLRHRLKFIKNRLKLLHVSVYDHLQGVTMSSLKSPLFDHSWMYTKRGGVAACCHTTALGIHTTVVK